MDKKWIFSLGCLGVLVVLGIGIVLWGVGIYNGLVTRDQASNAQWSQVENVYQRRADLIPNLVSTVAGAANFEKSTLTEITEARAQVGQVKLNVDGKTPDSTSFAQFQKAQDNLSSALSRLMVVVERYPDLKSNQGFLGLQVQLEGTENRISVERGRFNEVVQEYNVAARSFPAVLIAGILGFHPKPYFQATAGAEKPPEVKFDFQKK
ncbi:MAG: LemA family protein [Verrucomicrobiota bacterium]